MERFVSDRVGNHVACPLCGAPLVKNPLCSGDFYPTEFGITLMSYCKNGHCGLMQPDVERPKKLYFGKNKKRNRGTQVARAFHLSFRETEEEAVSIDETIEVKWKFKFFKVISKKHSIPVNRLEKAYAVI